MDSTEQCNIMGDEGMKNRVIQRDLPGISEALSEFESYNFSDDLRSRMNRLSLSSVALGERVGVSHTIVDKWLKNKARPNGKERMKELGMGLGMNADELNRFLFLNGYPRLYVKNPLDSVALQLLQTASGRGDVVELYQELLDKTQLRVFSPSLSVNDMVTSVMLSGLLKQNGEDLEGWLSEHKRDFVADAKSVIPDSRMGDFLRLYIGDESVYSLTATAELPPVLAPVLSAVLNRKSVTVRGLREKLIGLGLYLNLTEEEIDVLLCFVRLRGITVPVSRLDMALLLAIREGHEQYALYESENLEQVLPRIAASTLPYVRGLHYDYTLRLENARERADYYLRWELNEEEREFEERYTSYNDRGLMDYVFDILTALADEHQLQGSEIADFLENIQRPAEGESTWK